MIGVVDDEAPLQRVPFALLDVEPRSDGLPSMDGWNILPGLVPEPVSASTAVATAALWCSSTFDAVSFPREVAIRVLSTAHYQVHAIRIVFPKAKRPSRLEVSAASNTSSLTKRSPSLQALDTLSQYFCASFEPLGPPLTWSPESALDWLLSPTEVTIPMIINDSRQLQTPEFIRFVLHRPHPHPENSQNEIVITELEILGTFQLPGRSIPLLDDAFALNDSPEPLENTARDVRSILEAAGLSEELIRELLEATGETPESTISAIVPTTSEPAVGKALESLETVQQPQYLLDSVFDLALRDYIEHKRHQDELFASLDMPREGLEALMNESGAYSSATGLASSLSIGSIRQNDRNHLEAIATHTFGSFFTQCLVHDDNDLRLTSLQVSERFAPLLVLAGLGPELVYEGLVAVVLLATEPLNRTVSLGVFQAVLHLVQTTFQERRTGFRLVSELPKGKINTGLLNIVEALIHLPHCWSLGAKTTINRELLKMARLLLSQESTRTSFVLAVCQPRHSSSTSTNALASVNRLRLIRWLLQRHREKLSADDIAGIKRVCSELNERNNGSGSAKVVELIQQLKVLVESARPAKGDLNAQLQAVRRHLQEEVTKQDAGEVKDIHVPLFDSFPLTKQEQALYTDRLGQYLQLHPRPTALYQHEFTLTSLEDHATRGEFRKGNIVFKGQVEERSIPVVSFHEHVENKAKPFKFNAPRASGAGAAAPVLLETAFAKFRGTMEVRATQPMPAPVVQRPAAVTQKTSPAPTSLTSDVQMPQPRQPSPPFARRPSNPKLNRVVPVDSAPNPDTVAMPPPSGSDVVAVEPSVVKPATQEQRASTAAPVVAATKPPAVGIGSAAPDPAPSASSTKPALPKTAPAGKSRSSASQADTAAGGCAVQ